MAPTLPVFTLLMSIGILRLFKGHAAELLRHPYGSDVMAELYDVSSGAQRNALVGGRLLRRSRCVRGLMCFAPVISRHPHTMDCRGFTMPAHCTMSLSAGRLAR
jgi:hypothetical protein